MKRERSEEPSSSPGEESSDDEDEEGAPGDDAEGAHLRPRRRARPVSEEPEAAEDEQPALEVRREGRPHAGGLNEGQRSVKLMTLTR